MKNIKKLGLELIELENQVLLVRSGQIPDNWYLDDANQIRQSITHDPDWWCARKGYRSIIASTKPLEGLPLLVIEDEVDELAHEYFAQERFNWEQENPNGLKSPQPLVEQYNKTFTPLYKAGYNKSQETHPFSEEDMIEFMDWYKNKFVQIYDKKTKLHQISLTKPKTELTTKELLQLWKEQKINTLYYE